MPAVPIGTKLKEPSTNSRALSFRPSLTLYIIFFPVVGQGGSFLSGIATAAAAATSTMNPEVKQYMHHRCHCLCGNMFMSAVSMAAVADSVQCVKSTAAAAIVMSAKRLLFLCVCPAHGSGHGDADLVFYCWLGDRFNRR